MPHEDRKALRCIERHANEAGASWLPSTGGLETIARTARLHADLEAICERKIAWSAIGRSVTARAAKHVLASGTIVTLAKAVAAVRLIAGQSASSKEVLRIWGHLFLAVAANDGAPLTAAQSRRALTPVIRGGH